MPEHLRAGQPETALSLLSHPWRVMPVVGGRRMLCLHGDHYAVATCPNGSPRGEEMPLAASSSSYPLLNLFWTMFIFFLWVIWIWILIMVFIDIFRSHDLSGWAKALWVLFVVILPFLGVLIYLIARGSKMHEHAEQQAYRQDQEMRSYVQEAAGTSTADQLAKLADLRDRGVISAEEFDREKAKVLA
jgi:ABC-type multidrug transport system fused ATPase/permease subunit